MNRGVGSAAPGLTLVQALCCVSMKAAGRYLSFEVGSVSVLYK